MISILSGRTGAFVRVGVVILMAGTLSVFGQTLYSISEIQGNKGASPLVGKTVKVSGIVTAVLRKGFYIQTPDADIDKDPETSEGIYVYGEQSAGKVKLGDLANVTGTVSEYRPRNEEIFLSITEITRPDVTVASSGNPLPKPIVLTEKELNARGRLDQMERFEGMRVTASVTVVAPTRGYTNSKTHLVTSDGVFYVALQTADRPFREPGMEILAAIVRKMPAGTPVFDMNPEMLRVDSDAQIGSKPIDVPAGARIRNLTGVIDYSRKAYTLLVDAADPPVVEDVRGYVPVSPAGERELTVGSFNIENFFDDEVNSDNVEKEAVVPKDVFVRRLNKVSLAIRNVLAMPDILGIVEVENLKVLNKVAAKINADAVAAGGPDPKYVAYLEESNDIRGIDVGYLVKSTKVKVLETKQLASKVKLELPTAHPDEKLFDRPPLMIRAQVIDDKSAAPLTVTVIVNHIKSYGGIDDEKDGSRVQNKRRLEAEWLAQFIADRRKADPEEMLLVCGDFNAFQFNDGYNDLMGILVGRSSQDVLAPSKTSYDTGLINLTNLIDAKNRYSYVYDGSAQALDHMLISRPTGKRLLKFGYARVDADFPLIYENDPSRPERISDHDAPVVFLSLDEPQEKKP